MRTFRPLLLAGAATAAALAVAAAPAHAAHNGNNKAPLRGDGVTGTAILNYSEGTGTFSGTANVLGLVEGEDYSYVVNLNGGNEQTICTFTAGAGSSGCSANGLTLPGFNRAEIEDSAGNAVASGTFERRGNCRDPQQGGSQCEANDTRRNF
jgi:hypothetical protein